ncbi:MAG: hypothetical protein B7733_15210 [Myxococcales bacterium FL481]|nr:MAG: hypothetical protein B7733_15210 [Myxococcales bacterium FL481]
MSPEASQPVEKEPGRGPWLVCVPAAGGGARSDPVVFGRSLRAWQRVATGERRMALVRGVAGGRADDVYVSPGEWLSAGALLIAEDVWFSPRGLSRVLAWPVQPSARLLLFDEARGRVCGCRASGAIRVPQQMPGAADSLAILAEPTDAVRLSSRFDLPQLQAALLRVYAGVEVDSSPVDRLALRGIEQIFARGWPPGSVWRAAGMIVTAAGLVAALPGPGTLLAGASLLLAGVVVGWIATVCHRLVATDPDAAFGDPDRLRSVGHVALAVGAVFSLGWPRGIIHAGFALGLVAVVVAAGLGRVWARRLVESDSHHEPAPLASIAWRSPWGEPTLIVELVLCGIAAFGNAWVVLGALVLAAVWRFMAAARSRRAPPHVTCSRVRSSGD